MQDSLNKASKFHDAGDLDKAEEIYQKILLSSPNNVDALSHHGLLLVHKGEFPTAIETLRKALNIDQMQPVAWCSMGFAFMGMKAYEEAGAAFKESIMRDNNYVEAYYGISEMLKKMNRLEEAEQFCRIGYKISNGDLKIAIILSSILDALGKVKEAKEVLSAVANNNSDQPIMKTLPMFLSTIIWDSKDRISSWYDSLLADLSDIPEINTDEYIDTLLISYARPPCNINYYGIDSLQIKKAYAEKHNISHKPLNYTSDKDSMPKAAMVVTDDSDGIFMTVMEQIINGWNSLKVDLTIICDASVENKLRKVIVSENIKILPYNFHLNFLHVVDQIRNEGFDLVYFWESGSGKTNYFLPFYDLAPIQCTSWGTVESSGNPHIHYFISSKLQEAENAQNNYSEKLVLFENMLTCFKKPENVSGSFSRSKYDLDDNDNIYVIGQSCYKLHPDMDEIILGILQSDKRAKILLMEHHDSYKQGIVKQALDKRFSSFPEDMKDRIITIPRLNYDEYIGMINDADVSLDTLHYGAGVTALEALAFGTPIITLPGKYLKGRSTYACYKAMDFYDLVAENIEDYIKKAVRVATDKEYRTNTIKEIVERNSVLYDNQSAITELEDFFVKVINERKVRN